MREITIAVPPVLAVILTQALFTTGDLLARSKMRMYGFELSTFFSWWFLIYFALRQLAMFGQLYVFSTFQLGKSMALFGAASIVLSNLLAFLVLGELLSTGTYIGVTLAVAAFVILSL